MDRPTIDELKQWLTGPLRDTFGNRFEKPELLYQGEKVTDGAAVFMLRGEGDGSDAVVLCSGSQSPDLIQRSMDRAQKAKEILGPSAPILDPLSQDRVHGLSFAVLPYCNTLSKSRFIWPLQRAFLRTAVFDWLWRATEVTVRDIDTSTIDHCFAAPLRHLISLDPLDSHMKEAASLAIERLSSGEWVPRHVLMHGDLWKGNILIRPHDRLARRMKMADRFVIIDWAGAETAGYAIFDLIRLAQSMGLRKSSLRHEVYRHCNLLRCDPADATSYLLASLGFIAMNLEHFPFDRFLRMASSCYSTLLQIHDVSPK